MRRLMTLAIVGSVAAACGQILDTSDPVGAPPRPVDAAADGTIVGSGAEGGVTIDPVDAQAEAATQTTETCQTRFHEGFSTTPWSPKPNWTATGSLLVVTGNKAAQFSSVDPFSPSYISRPLTPLCALRVGMQLQHGPVTGALTFVRIARAEGDIRVDLDGNSLHLIVSGQKIGSFRSPGGKWLILKLDVDLAGNVALVITPNGESATRLATTKSDDVTTSGTVLEVGLVEGVQVEQNVSVVIDEIDIE